MDKYKVPQPTRSPRSVKVTNNDSLRVMFMNFVSDVLDIMLNCCKYGKLKGWLPVYPVYKAD